MMYKAPLFLNQSNECFHLLMKKRHNWGLVPFEWLRERGRGESQDNRKNKNIKNTLFFHAPEIASVW